MNDNDDTKSATDKADHSKKLTPRELRSEDLLAGAAEVQIFHRGEIYRLRETRNGKLILIK